MRSKASRTRSRSSGPDPGGSGFTRRSLGVPASRGDRRWLSQGLVLGKSGLTDALMCHKNRGGSKQTVMEGDKHPFAARPKSSPSLEGPVAQWLEPAAHNGLVPGSSPGGPTIRQGPEGNPYISPLAPCASWQSSPLISSEQSHRPGSSYGPMAQPERRAYCSVKKVSTTLPLSLTRQTKRFGLSLFSRWR